MPVKRKAKANRTVKTKGPLLSRHLSKRLARAEAELKRFRARKPRRKPKRKTKAQIKENMRKAMKPAPPALPSDLGANLPGDHPWAPTPKTTPLPPLSAVPEARKKSGGGKYADIAKRVPRLAPDPTEPFQVKVAHEKDTYTDPRTATALAKKYDTLRVEYDRLEADLKTKWVRVAAVEQLMWEAFEREETGQLKLESGASISVNPDLTVINLDPSKQRAWALANGLENLLSINASTFASLIKERVMSGLEIPEFVKVGCRMKTYYRK